jgi:hypothetical protein
LDHPLNRRKKKGYKRAPLLVLLKRYVVNYYSCKAQLILSNDTSYFILNWRVIQKINLNILSIIRFKPLYETQMHILKLIW